MSNEKKDKKQTPPTDDDDNSPPTPQDLEEAAYEKRAQETELPQVDPLDEILGPPPDDPDEPEEEQPPDPDEPEQSDTIPTLLPEIPFTPHISLEPLAFHGTYGDFIRLGAEDLKRLYSQLGENIFYVTEKPPEDDEMVEEPKKGRPKKQKGVRILQPDRVALYLCKTLYAKAFNGVTGDLYVWDESKGIYVIGDNLIAQWLETVLHKENDKHLFTDILYKVKAGATGLGKKDLAVNVIPCKNGNVVIGVDIFGRLIPDQITLKNPSPEYFVTSRLPTPYLPGECPEYTEFMNKLFSKKHVKFLNAYFGSMLHRALIEAVGAWIFGQARSGKSTLVKVALYILGDDSCGQVTAEELNKKEELIQMRFKLANLVAEHPTHPIYDMTGYKSLVAGDKQKGREYYKMSEMFDTFAKSLYALNQIPDFGELSESTFFRLELIKTIGPSHWDGKESYKTKLYAEAPAILSSVWIPAMIEAVNNGEYPEKSTWDETRELYNGVKNVLSVWINNTDKYELTLDSEDWVLKDDLLRDYNEYLNLNRISTIGMSQLTPSLSYLFNKQVYTGQHRIEGKLTPVYFGVKYKKPDTM